MQVRVFGYTNVILQDMLAYKWYIMGQICVRGFAYFNQSLLKDDGLARYFQYVSTPSEFVERISQLDGFFNVIMEARGGVFACVDQIRSMPLFIIKKTGTGYKKEIRDFLDADFCSSSPVGEQRLALFRHSLFTLDDTTLFSNATAVGAGKYAVIKDNKVTVRPYLSFQYAPKRIKNMQEAVHQLNRAYHLLAQQIIGMLDHRPAVLPLSGGHDSRLLLFYLKQARYSNIITYSYGMPGNEESEISRKVALYYGLPWYFVSYKKSRMRKLFREKYKEYAVYSFCGTAVPCLQEWYAVYYLKKEGLIPDNAVLLPGYTGDFMSGGHLVPVQEGEGAYTRSEVADIVVKRYFAEKDSRYPKPVQAYKKNICFLMESMGYGDTFTKDTMNEFIERFDWYNRQAKYIANAVRVYDFFGYQWVMPYFARSQFLVWGRIDNCLRYGRRCFFELERSVYPKEFYQIGFYGDNTITGQTVFTRLKLKTKWIVKGPSALHYMYGYYNLGVSFYNDIIKKQLRNVDTYAKDALVEILKRKVKPWERKAIMKKLLMLSVAFIIIGGIHMVTQTTEGVSPYKYEEEGQTSYDYKANPNYETDLKLFYSDPYGTDVVFAGDSITKNAKYEEIFSDIDSLNRGIGSDTSEGLLNRLDEIMGRQPSKIFIMIGVNDLAVGIPVEKISANMHAIIMKIKKEAPKCQIYIESVLSAKGVSQDLIDMVNARNEQLCSQLEGCKFIDLSAPFKDRGGGHKGIIYCIVVTGYI